MPKPVRFLLFAVILAGLLFLPRVVSPYKLLTYTTVLCLALMAQGWNFIGGYTGYAAFGNVAFFGIGAYTTGLLMLSKWHFPFFAAAPAGALLSAIVATAIEANVASTRPKLKLRMTRGLVGVTDRVGACKMFKFEMFCCSSA